MRPRIIVLEDDEDTRKLLCLLLERRGYEVVSASEPLICPLYTDLYSSCTHQFPCGDFLLTDIHMPRMSGLQFVAQQKKRGCKGVVHNKAVISGTWTNQELRLAEQLGCKVFIKPYRMTDIYNWLSEQEKNLSPDRQLTDLNNI